MRRDKKEVRSGQEAGFSAEPTRIDMQSSSTRSLDETARQTSTGRRIVGVLASGLGRRSSSHYSPTDSPNSPSLLVRRQFAFPILAVLAVAALGLWLLLPGGALRAQDANGLSGSGADCEENADKTGYDCEYAEKGTGPVATFTATDPEGAAVSWEVDSDSADAGDFRISKDGVLTFRTSPNYEATDTDNMHEVTVRATDNMYDIAGVTGMATTKTVTVMVTNVEEPGKVTLTVTTDIGGTPTQVPVLQPQMGELLTAMLSDNDGVTSGSYEWQWYRGSTEIIGATGTDATSTYTPVQADIGINLTAKATYTDGKNSDEKDMAEATTIMAVRAAPSSNSDPAFPDEDLSTSGVQKTPKRKVAENTPAGMNIGAPVKANDEGDVLAYSLSGDDAGLFAIDIATGQLKTKGKLNREDEDGGERTVTVTAVDPFGQSDTATVTITVENEDERPAIDERDGKTMLMYEEPMDATADLVLLWTYMAEDDEDDADNNANLEWKLEGADRSKLALTANSDGNGELKFVKNPDFEKPADANKDNVYQVTVVVTDSNDLTDTLAVRVEVTNAKETGEVTFTVATPRVGVPLTAMLEDPDGDETGHEWQWSVADTGTDADAGTAIDGATSATFTPRDRDLTKFLSVKVKYTDGKGKDEVTQVLATAVAPSAAPRFYKTASKSEVATKFTLTLAENTAANEDDKMVGDIYVNHRTTTELLTYEVSGADASFFKVIPAGSIAANDPVMLQAQGPLDKEEKDSYAVTVTATASDGTSATLPVTVKVDNINEMPDVSGSGADCEENAGKTGYECEYAEKGTGPVATFTATDPEGAAVSWDLDETGGTDHALFNISKDGVLSFIKSPNYEEANTDNEHMVTVRATDNMYDIAGVTGMATTKTVTVMVTNVEEPGKVTLTVNGTSGQPVLQPQMSEALTATLSDGDTPLTDIEWQWYRGSTAIIGATNGAGTMMSTYTPVESEIDSRLTAKATYMDGEDANNKKMAEATTMRSVRAAPQSNNDPAFPDEDLSTDAVDKTPKRKVAENTPAGMNIGAPVKANDEGDVLAYSLSGDDAGLFAIDIATGQLKTKGKLNREDEDGGERTVTVTAVDPFGQSDTATVTITVENEDERPAIDERDGKTMLMYEEPMDATADLVLLWTYMAEDDEDDAADLEWKLEGADEDKFSIGDTNADRGELKFLKNPDFEKPADANKDNVYQVTVVVTDSGDLTDTLAVRVEVTNATEDGEVTFTVGTPRVGVPLTAMLEDPDGDETGHEWQWSVADTGTDADAGTAIDGATSATFTPRDRDEEKFLSVKVKYTDGNGKDDAEEKIGPENAAVAVAASAAPRFYKTDDANADVVTKFEVKIEENTADNKNEKLKGSIHVGHRTDISVLQFAVGGTDAAYFKVSTATDDRTISGMRGTFQLQAQGPLDKEEKASYAVTVTATDSDGNSATLPVTVTVTPIDEMPVVMLGGLAITGPASVSYAEDRRDAVGTYDLAGPDSDSGRWTTLGGADAGDFRISSGGVLTFVRAPDFETPADEGMDNVYMVTLNATDSEGNTDTHNVVVRVTDVDDTVSEDTLLGTYDTSGNDEIEPDEMRVAVGHFFAVPPQLTPDEMRELVGIYFSS